MKPWFTAAVAVVWISGLTGAQAAPLRILSVDQCADQYALALAPDAVLALSPRADDPDSWMRSVANGHPRLRPTLEAAIAFRPDVVIRYWGGDTRLLASLEARGTRVVQIDDASDMAAVRDNLRKVSTSLGQPARGQALLARMDQRLAVASQRGARGSALYVTAGGFTSGGGTLIDAILRAAGFRNAAGFQGFGPVSVERIALKPPRRFVFGFFDQLRADWRGAGRHPVMRRAAENRTAARLPASVLGCPAWFAADAAAMLAEQAG